MQQDLREQKNQQIQQCETLEQQDNLLIEMLSSDKIIDIGIFVCFLGVLILGFCCYLLEGHLRFHLGVILFLMFGLGGSLMIYKCLNSTQPQQDQQTQNKSQEDQQQSKKDQKAQSKQKQISTKAQKSE